MTVKDVVSYPFIREGTLVYIRDEELTLLVCSFRFLPEVKRFWQSDVKAFSWDDSHDLYITIRED